MIEPAWVAEEAILLLHEESLAEHGGAPSARDPGPLQSALARPKNRFAHEGVDDVVRLATCYAFGIARNHPFVEGNERVAFVALELFLRLNGLELVADARTCLAVMLDLAAGAIEEEELAAWLRARTRPRAAQP